MITRHILGICILSGSLGFAQQGDRDDHANIDNVVPEELVPASPVLSVEEALKTFKLPEGFVIEAVGSEPMVEKPVALTFDSAGRMWVCEMRGYMTDIDGSEEHIPMGRISILEDTNGDGQIDKHTIFLDKILLPRAVSLVNDGLLYADQESLYFVKIKDDQPDGDPVVVDAEYAKGGSVEHKPNGLLRTLDNWLYNAKSNLRYKQVNGQWIKETTAHRGQWGIAQDNYGRLYHNDNSTWLRGEELMPNLLLSNPAAKLKTGFTSNLGNNRVYPSRVTPGVNRAYISKSNGYGSDTLDPETHKLINCTSACGPLVYRGTNFPENMRNWAFIAESSVNLLKAVEIKDNDGRLSGDHPIKEDEFLTSLDERFRPVNIFNAPDGSIYVLDMYHGVIQHKIFVTTYLRQQMLERGLDKPGLGHGRIYRIRYAGNDLEKPIDLGKADTLTLVKTLAHGNGWHRDTAQRLLVEQNDPETPKLLRIHLSAKQNELAVLHALWTLEGLGQLTADDIKPLLSSTNEHLLNSAIYASLSLDPGTRSVLLPELLKLPEGQATLPYKVRALADLSQAEAQDAVAAILKKDGKTKYVREAAISGMSQTGLAFSEKHNIDDKDFQEWMKNTLAGVQKEITPESYLSGDHLASFVRGRELFQGQAACFGCHGLDGAGLPNLGPLLDKSDWVTGNTERLIKILLHGLEGPITINGETFTPLTPMPGLAQNPTVNDQNLADIITYVRSAWSNRASAVSKDEVSKIRQATKDRGDRLYTEQDFK